MPLHEKSLHMPIMHTPPRAACLRPPRLERYHQNQAGIDAFASQAVRFRPEVIVSRKGSVIIFPPIFPSSCLCGLQLSCRRAGAATSPHPPMPPSASYDKHMSMEKDDEQSGNTLRSGLFAKSWLVMAQSDGHDQKTSINHPHESLVGVGRWLVKSHAGFLTR